MFLYIVQTLPFLTLFATGSNTTSLSDSMLRPAVRANRLSVALTFDAGFFLDWICDFTAPDAPVDPLLLLFDYHALLLRDY